MQGLVLVNHALHDQPVRVDAVLQLAVLVVVSVAACNQDLGPRVKGLNGTGPVLAGCQPSHAFV